jgi:hypothetical protein
MTESGCYDTFCYQGSFLSLRFRLKFIVQWCRPRNSSFLKSEKLKKWRERLGSYMLMVVISCLPFLTLCTMHEKTITFVTGNANKLSEFVSILGPNINFKVSYIVVRRCYSCPR